MNTLEPIYKILWELCRDTKEDVEEITLKIEGLRKRVAEDLSLTNHPYVIMHLRNYQQELETEVRNIVKNYLSPGEGVKICSQDIKKRLELLESRLAWLEKKLGLVPKSGKTGENGILIRGLKESRNPGRS